MGASWMKDSRETNLNVHEHTETFKSSHIRQPGCDLSHQITERLRWEGTLEVMWSNLPC